MTNTTNFYQGNNPCDLISTFGSPLYVYNERVFRNKCRDMVNLCPYPEFRVNYAIKANTNLTLLTIAKEEGLCADVSSKGEAVAALAAGFTAKEIMFIVNNASPEELRYAAIQGFCVSVDSLSQLKTYGELNPGGRVAVRFNPGMGGGHHEKVITGGDKTKFGITADRVDDVKKALALYDLKLVGINHHIGSQNDNDFYMNCAKRLLSIVRQFDDLDFVDFGGGFSIPYHKQDGETPLDLHELGASLSQCMFDFSAKYGKPLQCIVEPGRYISAESGVLLGTVHSVKNNGLSTYVGCDIGFSVFARPTLYDSHHDIEVYNKAGDTPSAKEVISIVGNQCESGDYIAKERLLPIMTEGDVFGVLDAGAYGYSMSSQYNHRQRPAEVLIREDGTLKLIRRRDTFEDMLRNMQEI